MCCLCGYDEMTKAKELRERTCVLVLVCGRGSDQVTSHDRSCPIDSLGRRFAFSFFGLMRSFAG